MPEEKKESFTFSDKIKNSKAAENKSFAKSSSKIGRDGKPKATLFQRTRRDAPFFIAALVALLLLPFLYKYSGQSSEEQLLTPGSDLTAFNPGEGESMLTTFNEDPSRQIAQLSGRDSLSLIKGWGADDEENVGRDDLDFDYDESASSAMDAEGRYDAEHASTSDIDIEENTTNIYKRRAKAGTRAAFRRAATKIGTLAPAHLGRPGGTGFGYKWGGGLKNAAKKVGPKGPTQGPKPVSLQPLRASAGRASFGGGNAAAARKGADNMGKANAREALRDSYVRPVDPTRTGGLDFTSGFTGGGAGKLDHHINIGKGETPWWWDMMKTRMQKEWEARFNRKWDWIKWADKLAQHILGGIINCLLTGDDSGDMGRMFGFGAGGGGKVAKCCGVAESGWKAELAAIGATSLTESSCKNILRKKYGNAKYKEACGDEFWEKGSSASGESGGFFAARLGCLGIKGSGYGSGNLGLNGTCEEMPTYSVIPSGEARKWNIYTYVVVRNYAPAALKDVPTLTTQKGKQRLLCGSSDRRHGGTSLNHADISAGVGHVEAKKDSELETNVIVESKESSNVTTEQQRIRENYLEYDQEALRDACVIAVSRGSVLPYEQVKNHIMDLFKEKYKLSAEEAATAFYQLDLMFVSSFATKHKLAYAQWFESGHHLTKLLPMPYWEFENAYINHRKVTHKLDGSRDNVRKWRVEGVDLVKGQRCYYGMQFSCGPENVAEATLILKQASFHGGDSQAVPKLGDVKVTAQFRPLNAGQESAKNYVVQPVNSKMDGEGNRTSFNNWTVTYAIQGFYADSATRTNEAERVVDGDGNGLVGTVVWTATRGAEVITQECPLNMSGDGYTKHVTEKKCSSAQQDEECCRKLMTESGLVEGTDFIWDPSKPVGSQCVRLCTNPEQSAECCEQLGQGATWHEEPNAQGKHCYQGITPPPPSPTLGQTRLAPVLSWVPVGKVDCRQQAGDDVNPTKAVFSGCNAKITGVVEGQREHCGSQTPIMMDSQAAATFVRDVVTAYNATNPTMKLSDKFYSNTYPTDGEFVDALFIADQLGIPDVPSSAVCELARDMVRMSKDPHAGHRRVEERNDFKDIPRFYRNDLGAFLVYVHPTSILYPNKYYGQEHEVCDWRFLPKGSTCRGIKSTMQMGKAFYFNYYNDSKKNANLQSYLGSFDKVGIKKTYPLAAITKGHSDLAHNCPTQDCANTRNSYNKDDYFGLMISDMATLDGQGKACVAFAGDNKMSVKKAIEYVQNVCTTGLDAKPYGNQSSRGTVATSAAIYDPNQTFTQTTNSRPGNDTSVQRQGQARGRG
ncbi:MAG: hypothetical protein J6Y25_02125 [Elusimicrobiaceae bacterium]|nr:hypothetical protein [Elusimicrobiaceae bacterium]